METEQFVQLVQGALLNGNAKTATRRNTLQIIEAILNTLSEVLQPKQIRQLVATLPPDIGQYLLQTKGDGHDTLNEFFYFVAAREGTTLPRAIHHSRTVISVLQEAVPDDVLQMIQEQLPHEFAPLFQ